MDPQAICQLAAGNIDSWSGLGHLEHTRLPACLGAPVRSETRRFRFALLASDVYEPASGWARVRVNWFMNGGRVALIDVSPVSPPDAAALLARLGAPERAVRYSIDELAEAGLSAPPGGRIEEAVFAARGLSLVVQHDAAGAVRLVGIRAFSPMPAEHYEQDYVLAEPEAIE